MVSVRPADQATPHIMSRVRVQLGSLWGRFARANPCVLLCWGTQQRRVGGEGYRPGCSSCSPRSVTSGRFVSFSKPAPSRCTSAFENSSLTGLDRAGADRDEHRRPQDLLPKVLFFMNRYYTYHVPQRFDMAYRSTDIFFLR